MVPGSPSCPAGLNRNATWLRRRSTALCSAACTRSARLTATRTPGNYLFHLFHGGGKVTFLDFGLVKYFTLAELQPLMEMNRRLCVEHDPEAFRRSLENAGFLRPNAPLSTEAIVEHLAVFYDTIREPGPLTITGDYASSVVRRFFDVRSPVMGFISVPRSYVILQRINLGLFAILGELSEQPSLTGPIVI